MQGCVSLGFIPLSLFEKKTSHSSFLAALCNSYESKPTSLMELGQAEYRVLVFLIYSRFPSVFMTM